MQALEKELANFGKEKDKHIRNAQAKAKKAKADTEVRLLAQSRKISHGQTRLSLVHGMLLQKVESSHRVTSAQTRLSNLDKTQGSNLSKQ